MKDMYFGVNRRVLYTFVSAAIILTGTLVAIRFARGNFRVTRQGFIPQTGLLSANSFPTGAEVKINGRLVTATDDTIYLAPGTYSVEITKDGYSPWQKELKVEEELVTTTNAQLFRITPSLSPLTFAGVSLVSPSPDGQKLLYYTASASAAAKNGLYLIELSTNPLSIARGPRQIAEDVPELDLGNSTYMWSPDSSQIMVVSKQKEVVIDVDKKSDLRTLPDISLQRKQLLSGWEEEMYLRERQFLSKFPPEVIAFATQSAKNAYLSPDKKRLLYTATAELTIPDSIVPPVPASNSHPQDRNIKPGNIYVYDREEDTNYLLGPESKYIAQGNGNTGTSTVSKILLATDLDSSRAQSLSSSPSAFTRLQASTSAETTQRFNAYHTSLYTTTFQWMPDSRHLLYDGSAQRIQILEYDGSNDTTVYAGPFQNNFMYPWPDGSKVLIITSFSPDSPANLYAVELK